MTKRALSVLIQSRRCCENRKFRVLKIRSAGSIIFAVTIKARLGLLEEAAAALPDRPMVQYHLGATYIAIGQPAKAADQLKKALALSPDSSLQEKIKAAQKKAASN